MIDARGLLCPWPALRVARALRDGAAVVTIRADDPKAPAEIARVAADSGATLATDSDQIGPFFVVTRAPLGNGVFTQSG